MKTKIFSKIWLKAKRFWQRRSKPAPSFELPSLASIDPVAAQKRADKVGKYIMTDEELDRVRQISPEMLLKRFDR